MQCCSSFSCKLLYQKRMVLRPINNRVSKKKIFLKNLSKNSREMTKKTHNDNHTRDTINYGSFTTMVTFEAVNPIS